MVLECAPFWVFQYTPSQDGPSHLHNASVLAHYGTEPIYGQYYLLTPFQPAGNMLTQFLLAGLLKVTGPLTAEKLLLTGYVVLLFLSFRYFLAALTPYADYFSPFAGILAANWFLYMGFWNFIYSAGFLLLTLGYYIRHEGRWTARSTAVLGMAGLILYLTHAVSWIVCVVAVAILGLQQLISVVRSEAARRALRQYALPLVSVLPPGFLMLLHLMRSREETACDVIADSSFRQRAWTLYSLSFLHTISASDVTLAKALAAVLFLALVAVAGVALWWRRYDWRSTNVLVLSLACAVIAVAGPDCVGSGSYIHRRVAMYAWLFLVAWLAMQHWQRLALHFAAALFCGMAVISAAARFPALSQWNKNLSEYVAVGMNIRPRSTVLRLALERSEGGVVDPYGHSVGLLSSRAIIDLGNYEASTDYFSTRFRPERSPFPALGTMQQLQSAPPVFDILRYERETQGRVDYILFQGAGSKNGMEPLEVTLYRNQIGAYTLMSTGLNGTLRLYQRASR